MYSINLIKNLRTPNEPAGEAYQNVISRFQQASGISKPIFEHPSIPLPYVTGVMCQAIRKYLVDIEGIIISICKST